jgi:hypothetical protein
MPTGLPDGGVCYENVDDIIEPTKGCGDHQHPDLLRSMMSGSLVIHLDSRRSGRLRDRQEFNGLPCRVSDQVEVLVDVQNYHSSLLCDSRDQ